MWSSNLHFRCKFLDSPREIFLQVCAEPGFHLRAGLEVALRLAVLCGGREGTSHRIMIAGNKRRMYFVTIFNAEAQIDKPMAVM